MKITQDSKCRICEDQEETIMHLFTECLQVVDFWNQIEVWIQTKLNINLQLNPLKIIMGHLNTDNNAIPMNTIILVAKKYIFTTALLKNQISIISFKRLLNKIYAEQQLVAKLSQVIDKFNKNWSRFQTLFE